MRITTWIAATVTRLRSLFSKKESIMSDQTVINPTTTIASSPAEDFANEVATPVAVAAVPEAAPAVTSEAITPAPVEAAPVAAAEVAPPSVPEAAAPIAAEAPPAAAAAQSHDASEAFSEGVKDFGRAFNFVEQGVIKLGDAAKDELIELARKYL
jgi:hypothetical protein